MFTRTCVVLAVLLAIGAAVWLAHPRPAEALPPNLFIKEFFTNPELTGAPVGFLLRDCVGQWHSSGFQTSYYRTSYEDCDYWPATPPTQPIFELLDP
jgi:hypothetical protein